jgi:hypothetical protein
MRMPFFNLIYLYSGDPAPASSAHHLELFRFAIFTRFSTRLGLGLGLEFKQGTLEHRSPFTFAPAHTLRSIFSRHSW